MQCDGCVSPETSTENRVDYSVSLFGLKLLNPVYCLYIHEWDTFNEEKAPPGLHVPEGPDACCLHTDDFLLREFGEPADHSDSAGDINEAELRHLASSLNFCCRNWEVAFVTTNTSKKWSLIHSFVSWQKTNRHQPKCQKSSPACAASSFCRCEFTNWCFCLYIKHNETIWSMQINHRKTNILSFSRSKLLICHSSTPSTASNITVNQAGHLCCRLRV